MTILIAAPLEAEKRHLAQHLGLSRQITMGRVTILTDAEQRILLVAAGHGKAQFGVVSQHLLDWIGDIKLFVCAGAAGSLSSEVSTGDVVVATTTIEHDFRRRFRPADAPHFDGDAKSISVLERRKASGAFSFGVHFGLIASGDEDVVEAERASELRSVTGAVAVAWEGAGGARASRFSGIPFLEVRGITDQASADSASQFEANLPDAMAHVSSVLGHLGDVTESF